ncbi:MAG: hypothetical protein Hyperionvirus10_24 [Hyperionvirus sp.]|uniref:Uncharacterized protein n=1 Tax=Hyperionvirus sp. TaxID=2487770 RepID=A0A3G5A8W0_9VIRU|nr:MAG: hypothetical protein Hyperionvirus10_24 [Hyperionvirus sp.]
MLLDSEKHILFSLSFPLSETSPTEQYISGGVNTPELAMFSLSRKLKLTI